MKSTHILVFDFETTSIDPYTCQPVQLAAAVIDFQNLRIQENYFSTFIKPEDFSIIDQGNIEFHAKARSITKNQVLENWQKAPDLKVVWSDFTKYVQQFGRGWSAPLAAGHNIVNFDCIIAKRMMNRFKSGEIFHPLHFIDTMNLSFLWLHGKSEVEKYNMDYLREYFGMSQASKDNAHDALSDVKDTAELLIRYLKLTRNMASKVTFRGAFNQ